MSDAAAGRDVWPVGGGELVGRFADQGLVDEVWIPYAPVTLGSGEPVLPRRLDLERFEMVRNGNFVCARYAVTRELQHHAAITTGLRDRNISTREEPP